jgi:hypothetical protein
MEQQVKEILEKTASYIELTQTELDKQNKLREAFLKRAHQVAGVLANKGLISHDAVNAFVDKVAANESGTEVWDLVEKLANAVSVDELGGAAKLASAGRKLDAFERLALFGDAHADPRQTGTVD